MAANQSQNVFVVPLTNAGADDERDRHPFALIGSYRAADLDGRRVALADQVIWVNPDAAVIGLSGHTDSHAARCAAKFLAKWLLP